MLSTERRATAPATVLAARCMQVVMQVQLTWPSLIPQVARSGRTLTITTVVSLFRRSAAGKLHTIIMYECM